MCREEPPCGKGLRSEFVAQLSVGGWLDRIQLDALILKGERGGIKATQTEESEGPFILIPRRLFQVGEIP